MTSCFTKPHCGFTFSHMDINAAYAIAKRSYGACLMSKGFFQDFYDAFVERNKDIADKFKNTDMDKQIDMLKNSLSLMIRFSVNEDSSKKLLQTTAMHHSRNGLDIKPDFYNLWLACLIETVEKHDRSFSEQVKLAWRQVMMPGIDFFKSLY